MQEQLSRVLSTLHCSPSLEEMRSLFLLCVDYRKDGEALIRL